MKILTSLLKRKHLLLATILPLLVVTLGVLPMVQPVAAATATRPLALVYYGWHDSAVDQRIINAAPEILIDNTPAGYWHGNANVALFQSQGIKVFSYIDSSYGARPIGDNYALIDAIAKEGSFGIFMDQASSSATAYNQNIYNYAKSKGLSVIINPGMPYVSADVYTVADYVMTDEHYVGRAPTAVEATHLDQTIVIGFGNWTAAQAASYTNAAWSNGFAYSWHEQLEYNSLPSWLEEYVLLLSASTTTPSPTPTPTPVPSSGNVTGVVASVPVSSGGSNEYNLSIRITTTTVSGLTIGQNLWVAASTTDFPNLLTVGSTLTGNLDNSFGWWIMKAATPTTTINRAPVLNPIGNKAVTVGQNLEFVLSATDADGNALSFSASNLPSGASFSNARFSWTPTQTGTYNVSFTVSDGKLTDSETISIVVTYPNRAPVLNPIGNKAVTVGQNLEFVLSATDADGNALSFSASNLPSGASFSNARFSWTPTQTGTYNVSFTVSDGKLTDSETISIVVNAMAPPPSIGNTTGVIASVPVSSGGSNEYNLSIRITTTTVFGLTIGQNLWVAASTTDFPNLLTVGSTLTGNLDNSLGWWVMKSSIQTTPVTPPVPVVIKGNTTAVVASVPISSGGSNEYNLSIKITTTTITGLKVTDTVWVAASKTDFPNLLIVGSTVTGDLDKTLGWWTLKAVK
ncbi:MAG: Ig-like domain-containing protein [Dehalogenimonas sp.]